MVLAWTYTPQTPARHRNNTTTSARQPMGQPSRRRRGAVGLGSSGSAGGGTPAAQRFHPGLGLAQTHAGGFAIGLDGGDGVAGFHQAIHLRQRGRIHHPPWVAGRDRRRSIGQAGLDGFNGIFGFVQAAAGLGLVKQGGVHLVAVVEQLKDMRGLDGAEGHRGQFAAGELLLGRLPVFIARLIRGRLTRRRLPIHTARLGGRGRRGRRQLDGHHRAAMIADHGRLAPNIHQRRATIGAVQAFG